MNRAAREQAERDAVQREFWRRVLAKNGCVPPHAFHVEEDDRPPAWLGIILIIVGAAMVGVVIWLAAMAVS